MGFREQLGELDKDRLAKALTADHSARLSGLGDCQEVGEADFLALLSPSAQSYLEQIARTARNITLARFGRTILLYTPLYLSNECTNECVYCGFNRRQAFPRKTLSVEEAIREAQILSRAGFGHLLLVAGEAPRIVDLSYLEQVVNALSRDFASISIEIQPFGLEMYERLSRAGVDGLALYQETYDEEIYAKMHPRGPKSDFTFRLNAIESGAKAGFRRVNLGALLGLNDWRYEAFMLGLHAKYLLKRHWRTQVCISFPRLRPVPGGFMPPHPVSDSDLVQMICALRLFLPDAGLVLSTRESPEFRNHLIGLCITQMSAGSQTRVGGYSDHPDGPGQFEVNDRRSPVEMAKMIASRGFEPVWKDWDRAFMNGDIS